MSPFIVSTIATEVPLPADEPLLSGQSRAYASNGSWRFRIPARFLKASGLEAGSRLQLFRHAEGWVLRRAEDPTRLACVTVDFEQKIQLHSEAIGLPIDAQLSIAALAGALVLRPLNLPMPALDTPDHKAFSAFGWRWAAVSALKDRAHIRFIDVQGKFLSDTGLAPGDRVRVTVYEDRVTVLKDDEGPLLCMDKKTFPGFRLSARYFEQFGEQSQVVAVYGRDGIILLPSKDELAKFGLGDEDEMRVSMVEVAKRNFSEKHKGREKLDGPEMAVPPSTEEDAAGIGAVAWTILPVLESGKVHTRHIDIDGLAGKVVGMKRGQPMELRLYSDQVMLVKAPSGGVKCARLSDSLGVRLKTRFFDWLLEGDEVVTVLGTAGIAILRSVKDLSRFSLTPEDRLAA